LAYSISLRSLAISSVCSFINLLLKSGHKIAVNIFADRFEQNVYNVYSVFLFEVQLTGKIGENWKAFLNYVLIYIGNRI
jgi:hypothetical protein